MPPYRLPINSDQSLARLRRQGPVRLLSQHPNPQHPQGPEQKQARINRLFDRMIPNRMAGQEALLTMVRIRTIRKAPEKANSSKKGSGRTSRILRRKLGHPRKNPAACPLTMRKTGWFAVLEWALAARLLLLPPVRWLATPTPKFTVLSGKTARWRAHTKLRFLGRAVSIRW